MSLFHDEDDQAFKIRDKQVTKVKSATATSGGDVAQQPPTQVVSDPISFLEQTSHTNLCHCQPNVVLNAKDLDEGLGANVEVTLTQE